MLLKRENEKYALWNLENWSNEKCILAQVKALSSDESYWVFQFAYAAFQKLLGQNQKKITD